MILSEAELIDAWTELFTPERHSRAFRVELLSRYSVASDGRDYDRWLAGEPEPTRDRKEAVLQGIRDRAAAGLVVERVKVMADPRTDYDRYACEWGYAYNGPAGERIRVWDLAEHPLPGGIVDHDFWLFDDDAVLAMHYDRDGRFAGATRPGVDELPAYLATRAVLWSGATPFETWWPAHPELLRSRRAA